jgi:hypothetical protein
MMEAARTSETLVNFYQTTRHYNPVDGHLHPKRCLQKKGRLLRLASKAMTTYSTKGEKYTIIKTKRKTSAGKCSYELLAAALQKKLCYIQSENVQIQNLISYGWRH